MSAPSAPPAHLSEYRLPLCLSPGPVDSRDWARFLWACQTLVLEQWAGFLRVQVQDGSTGGMPWGRWSVGPSVMTDIHGIQQSWRENQVGL